MAVSGALILYGSMAMLISMNGDKVSPLCLSPIQCDAAPASMLCYREEKDLRRGKEFSVLLYESCQ